MEQFFLSKRDRETIIKSALFYIKEVQRKLAIQHWTKFNLNEETVVVTTPDVEYSILGIQLAQKHLTWDGWECKLVSYSMNHNKLFCYTFVMKPKK